LANFVGGSSDAWGFRELFRESLLIGGWVAMWRPLELFLYDWWPIRAEARLYDRLSDMPVGIAYESADKPHAWQTDWPAVAPSDPGRPTARPGGSECPRLILRRRPRQTRTHPVNETST
jgi:hypothetical protein